MGLIDRVKKAVWPDVGADPNKPLGGEPGRGEVIKVGNYIADGDAALNRRDGKWQWEKQTARWNSHEFVVVPVGAGRDEATAVQCYLGEAAHRAVRVGVVVPLRIDPASRRVLGLDVAAWEAEVEAGSVERARPAAPPDATAG